MQSERRFMISRNGIILIIYAFVMFFPGYFSGTLIDLLDNLLFVTGIAILVISKYRPSKFVFLMFLYFAYLIAISFYNGLANADIHMIISNMKMVVFVAYVENQILRRTKESFDLLMVALGILVLIDFCSLVFWPQGLYTSRIEWNDWSTSDVRHWFFGNKNNRVYWYMLLQLLMFLKYKIFGDGKGKRRVVAFSIMAIIGMFLSESSTAIIVILISTIAFLIGIFKKKPIKFNSYVVVIVYLIIWGMVVSGATGFMENILAVLFNKDTTFSGRARIWQTIMASIVEKPIFGWGNISGKIATDMLEHMSFTSAHNQILNTLWHGGLCLLGILVFLVLAVLKRIQCLVEQNMKVALSLGLFALFIDMIFESILSVQASWMFLFLCYITSILATKHQGERG